jgi:cell division protein FtsI (penicillin-binding protein 3)
VRRRRRAVRRRSAALPRRRLAVLAGFGVLAYAALLGRAIQLQAIDAERLTEIAKRQQEREWRLTPLRGEIRDREGRALALSASVESVAASPRRLEDRRRATGALARELGLRRSAVEARMGTNPNFVWIERWVTPAEADRVRGLKLSGVSLLPERKRFYPNRELAAAYLGFAGRDGRGLSGLELALDEALRGEPMSLPARRDGRGHTILRWEPEAEVRKGANAVLTLDLNLQHAAEAALDRALESTRARHATLVALDPHTGDVLAAAERPSFDANRFWQAHPSAHRARAFVDVFEPGSTLKPFVVAVALEAGAVDPTDRFDCENGAWRVLDRVIRDYKPHGVLDVRDIVRLSSNIGAAKIADVVGSARLVEGLRRLGFGERTGSEFPGELDGTLRSIREAQAVERSNLAFGQGLTVTAVQLAAAGAMLANGGHRVRPRTVSRLETPASRLDLPYERGERVLSAATARTVMGMLEEVVRSGTGRAAALPHRRVAGKTGTAQKAVNGTYTDEHYVASFLGVVPADAPRLVIAVVLDEPRSVHTGGAAAAPAFREVAAFAVERLGRSAGGAE